MTFIVSAAPEAPGDGSFRVTKKTRKAAVETAVGLIAQSFKQVTITDEAGRVFQPSEFDDFRTEED